jgi:SAM-dependent methyltransferase
MTVFGQIYASAYDSLYQDKDYEKECDFLEGIFRKSSGKIRTVLDLGCGTGGHALILAKRGYQVTGVDRSADMLSAAKEKAQDAAIDLELIESPIQELNLGRKFDAVISMFAVFSYQIENRDLALACKTARNHLNNDGTLVFDAWHGLAVMTDPPTERAKEIVSGDKRIIRITRPSVNALSHTVDTNFKVLNLNKGILTSETEETHTMRFLFPEEIKYFLEVAGFNEISFCPFLRPDSRLTMSDWNMTVVAR